MENIEEIKILIILGCIGMFILVIAIILFVVIYNKRILQQQHQVQEEKIKYNKELIAATIQVEEREREKIAKNIHDDLGALLNVMRLNNINAIKKVSNETVVLKVLEDNKALLNATSEIVRSIARDLAPPTLIKLGFVDGLKELCKQLNTTESINVGFKTENVIDRFEQKIEVQLYRITHEIINNILKHATATDLQITLLIQENILTLSLVHNGKGIGETEIGNLMTHSKGLGLKNVQTRVQSINGAIQYVVPSLKESKIIIDIPLSDEEN